MKKLQGFLIIIIIIIIIIIVIISARRPDLIKKENLQNCRLCCPADHRIKLKESEKKDEYLDLAWELKKKWNIKMTIIPIVIGAFCTVTK